MFTALDKFCLCVQRDVRLLLGELRYNNSATDGGPTLNQYSPVEDLVFTGFCPLVGLSLISCALAKVNHSWSKVRRATSRIPQ